MTKENLKDLIKSYEATDILCPETNLPIFANEKNRLCIKLRYKCVFFAQRFLST